MIFHGLENILTELMLIDTGILSGTRCCLFGDKFAIRRGLLLELGLSTLWLFENTTVMGVSNMS